MARDAYSRLLKKAMHRSTATHSGIAETVFSQLSEDFPPEKLGWVRSAKWDGPMDVPLSEIDFSNRAKWRASGDPEHVNHFRKQVKSGEVKPAILVNEPNNSKMIIVDGHHRALAAEKEEMPLRAYVTHVGTVKGPWDELHGSQRGGSKKK